MLGNNELLVKSTNDTAETLHLRLLSDKAFLNLFGEQINLFEEVVFV